MKRLLGLMMTLAAWISMGAANEMTLWYDKPAQYWEEALPIGNGHLGGMVSGAVATDTLFLNEDTFWSGSPYNNCNYRALGVLGTIRQKIWQKNYIEAQQLAMDNIIADGKTTAYGMAYEAVGRLLITPGHDSSKGASAVQGSKVGDADVQGSKVQGSKVQGSKVGDADVQGSRVQGSKVGDADVQGSKAFGVQGIAYRRWLDISNATAGVTYTIGKVTYTRTYFASLADNVIVVRLTASDGSTAVPKIDCLAPERRVRITKEQYDANTLMIRSTLEADSMEHIANKLHCVTMVRTLKDSKGVTLIISSATNFRNYRDISGDAKAKALAAIEAWGQKDYDTALAAHVSKYKEQFDRVTLTLGDNPAQSGKDTETRIREFSNTQDPALAAMYFQFGRYLLISSSQPGTQPANLQGIWNPDGRQYPAWDSKYTLNINAEMNYWPAEVTNLSECHEPLLSLIRDVSITGQEAAQKMYGCRGWTLHHNTDLWRATGAVDYASCAVWPTANAWLCRHLWERYLYSGDKEYLRSVYPIMKSAAQFYQDFLVEDPETGRLVVSPSNSPENNPDKGSYTDANGKKRSVAIFAGVTMDNQMVKDLMLNTAQAARLLEGRNAYTDTLLALTKRLLPTQVGQYGQIQEWADDWDREYSSHRHLSHLWAAYPGSEITEMETPNLFAATKKSLIGRGDRSRGWAMGWKVCLWARMKDGNHALTLIKNQLKLKDANVTIKDQDGGTYTNMFDAHPPFQIDGNFGCTAGIAEMLVQSHQMVSHQSKEDSSITFGQLAAIEGYDAEPQFIIETLPALPDEWSKGEVTGLRCRGGFVITRMKWADGKVTKLEILSERGNTLYLKLNGELHEYPTREGERMNIQNPMRIVNPILE